MGWSMGESARCYGADASCTILSCVASAEMGAAGFHHSMKRRYFVHDYKGRSICLITLDVAGLRRVAEELMKIGEHVVGVKPLVARSMPDHFHGILFVTCEDNRSLGSIMAGFKGKCSQMARELWATWRQTPRIPNPPRAPSRGARITRDECVALNAIAAELCGGNANDILYQGL